MGRTGAHPGIRPQRPQSWSQASGLGQRRSLMGASQSWAPALQAGRGRVEREEEVVEQVLKVDRCVCSLWLAACNLRFSMAMLGLSWGLPVVAFDQHGSGLGRESWWGSVRGPLKTLERRWRCEQGGDLRGRGGEAGWSKRASQAIGHRPHSRCSSQGARFPAVLLELHLWKECPVGLDALAFPRWARCRTPRP